MMHWWGSGYGMGFGGGIVMILFWILIFWGIIYLGKMLMGGDNTRETAHEVLEKRFSRGEISREEFEEAMEVLKRNQA